jgi:beta-phosphoglucomutase
LKEPINAILWDLDGTIVDTKACHYFTWQSVIQSHGFMLDDTVYEQNFGRNNMTLLPLLLGFTPRTDLITDMIEEKEELFRQIAPEQIKLIPGVQGWLTAANQQHLKQAIASSAPAENITTMLRVFDLERYFSAIISGSNLPAKPEPDVFFQAADSLEVSPKNCLVIEDSIAGVEAAHRAGMRCIAVLTTHHREELIKADLVVDDFTEPFAELFALL